MKIPLGHLCGFAPNHMQEMVAAKAMDESGCVWDSAVARREPSAAATAAASIFSKERDVDREVSLVQKGAINVWLPPLIYSDYNIVMWAHSSVLQKTLQRHDGTKSSRIHGNGSNSISLLFCLLLNGLLHTGAIKSRKSEPEELVHGLTFDNNADYGYSCKWTFSVLNRWRQQQKKDAQKVTPFFCCIMHWVTHSYAAAVLI